MRSLCRSVSAFAIAVAFALLCVGSCQLLPKEFTPTAYHLKIDASNFTASDTFSGAVLVNISLTSSVSNMMIHAENLTINETSVAIKIQSFSKKDQWNPIKSEFKLSIGQTLMTISFSSPVAKGEYSVYIEFSGYYQSSMAGFAKVGYHFKSEQKYLGVTALEPINARKVFPCFDVPWYKTTITLEVNVTRPHVVVSNVIPNNVHNSSDTTRVFMYNKYPLMQVNQLGWAILDQTSYSLHEDNSTPTYIHTRAPLLYLNQSLWANSLTANLVQALTNFSGIEFKSFSDPSYSKIEQIVVPEFFTGTSEGLGFITFSEESLLVSPDKSSSRYIQDVALTLSRGLVQQWFATKQVDSWEDIWMLKGLNQFLQYVIADSLQDKSDWDLRSQAVIELTQAALALDSAKNHPLTVQSDNETELVNTVSDSLTKYKGGALMRMLEDVLGSSFQESIGVFMRNKDDKAVPGNVWNVMYQVADENNVDLAHKDMETIMGKWISTPGYPVLSVSSNTSHFIISQPNGSEWWVPVSYSLQNSPGTNKAWLKPNSSFTVPASSSKYILLNLNQTGFFRVNYTSSLWKILSAQLSADLTQVPRLSRSQLIDDTFSLHPQMALEFTGFLRSETDYYPWATALRHYQTLIYSMAGHSSYQLLQNYALELMTKVIADVGFISKSTDTHVDKLKRSLVLEKACQFGHEECIKKAVANLKTWMAQTYYDTDLTPALLCAGIANSSTEMWHSVRTSIPSSIFPSVRLALLQSLTCTRDKDLLYQFLDNITLANEPVVNNKDKTILLQTLSSKPFGANVLLYWLADRLRAQTNSSSAVTTTLAPSTTVAPATTPNTTSSNEVADQPVVARLEQLASPALKTVTPTKNLTEADVVMIVNLITPLLTTTEEGATLDSLTVAVESGLSNSTLEVMRAATKRIYLRAEEVSSLNTKMISWLEAEAASTTSSSSSTGGSTKPGGPTGTPPSSQTTPSPNSGFRLSLGSTPFLLAAFLCVLAAAYTS